MNATRQSILAQVSGSSGLVTIVSTPSPFLHAVPRALGRFWAEHPDVEVKTIVRFGTIITDSVKNGSADLGIHTGLFVDDMLERRPLAVSRVLYVCGPNHLLAGQVATAEEIAVMEEHLGKKGLSVLQFVRGVTKLGGFLGRKGDGEPGIRALWRGYQRLQDMVAGYRLRGNRRRVPP